MATLTAWWIAIMTGVGVAAVVSMPRWLFSSINRGYMWGLRDDIFDAQGVTLPARSEAVESLVEQLENLIMTFPGPTPLQLRWWIKRVSPEAMWTHREPTDLSSTETEAFRQFEHRMECIVIRQFLTGSWGALVFVAPRRWREYVRLREAGPRRTTLAARDIRRTVMPVELAVSQIRRRSAGRWSSDSLVSAAG